MSAYWKIPLQALILLTGVLVFLFYLFTPAPLLYNPQQSAQVQQRAPAAYADLQARYASAIVVRQQAAREAATVRHGGTDAAIAAAVENFRTTEAGVTAIRTEALAAAEQASGESSRDVNYIIPRFVLDNLPLGFAGVFLAAVLAAAMSSVAAELNSLSTVTVIDFYQRWLKPTASDAHYLNVSKISTAVWGAFACVVATYAATLGSLIEVVNRFGSFFYGSILGIFLLAMIPRSRAFGAFVGLLCGMGAVAAVAIWLPSVSFLWHNLIGAVVVVAVGLLLSLGAAPSAPVTSTGTQA